MATPDHVREPCPDRIVDDVGGAFAMGALGGSVYHAVAGARRSPRGHFRRLRGAGEAVAMNAPRIGGSFAVWGGLFSAFDCGFVQLRQKEDPWNSIAAGASTGGVLQLRQGPAVAARSAVLGGLLLGLIEGAAVLMNRLLAPPPHPVTVAAANSPHNTGARSDPDLDVFGSHSAAPPAMPSFDVELLMEVGYGIDALGTMAKQRGFQAELTSMSRLPKVLRAPQNPLRLMKLYGTTKETLAQPRGMAGAVCKEDFNMPFLHKIVGDKGGCTSSARFGKHQRCAVKYASEKIVGHMHT